MMPHTATRMRSCILSPIDDDHCYVLSCYSVNGVTSAEDKALLRAAPHELYAGREPSLDDGAEVPI